MNMQQICSTRTYYVLLMPNDDYCVRAASDPVLGAESQAIDCWPVEATSKEHALGKLLHNFYNQLRPPQKTQPHNYSHSVDTCHACHERSLGF